MVMRKKFKFEFNQENGILHKHYLGEITFKDIESSWKYAFENNLIPETVKGFILNYQKAHFKMEVEEHVKIADFYKQNLDKFGNYKFAIITNNPHDITIPVMVSNKDDGYESKPFSTVEGAKKWILD